MFSVNPGLAGPAVAEFLGSGLRFVSGKHLKNLKRGGDERGFMFDILNTLLTVGFKNTKVTIQ